MAHRKYYKPRKYKRKSVVRRTRRSAPVRALSQNYGVPQKTVRKLNYCDVISLSSAGGFIDKHVFTGNGLYDPDVTGTGHQPYGFDQISLIYNNYRVLGATCHVDIINNGSQTSIQHVGVIASKSAILSSTTLTTQVEKSRGKHMYMFGANSRDRYNTSVACSTKTAWSVKDISDDESFSAATSSNPANLWYFQIFNQSIGGTTTGVIARVRIEYNVEFFNPIIADSS